MPLSIIRNDITNMHVDAIVNAANSSLLGGGGVDGAIHRAAGPNLLKECRTLDGCAVGQAKLTKGYQLAAKYIIHTVGPIWQGGTYHEEQLLEDCYRNALAIAKSNQFESIAFPLISSGAYGYPKDKALQVAIFVLGEFLLQHEMMIYLVVFDSTSFVLSNKLFSSITQYIDDKYVEENSERFLNSREDIQVERRSQIAFNRKSLKMSSLMESDIVKEWTSKRKLDDIVKNVDESFSQMLLRLIDEKNITDAQAYKKANVDRKLFSKIRNDIAYRPRKSTAIAFAIALELNLDETKDLLQKAGFALSHSNKFDIIVEYFIERGNYNVFEINEALFAFDQNLLGM